MCTAISFTTDKHFFGRNLDLNYNYPQTGIFVPRNYKITFKKEDEISNHFALLGVGIVVSSYPMFFDCINEYGLTFAGLNFPTFAKFNKEIMGKINLAPYELPLYLLSKYKTIEEVKKALENISILDEPFSKDLNVATLHFIMSDKNKSIVIESREDGLKVFDNPFNVLTNNPIFEYHAFNMNNYLNLTNEEPKSRFSKDLDLKPYGKGFGQIGLPGDSSPQSRFVKATYLLHNVTLKEKDDIFNISQGFHILNNVSTLIGECNSDLGTFEYTIYSDIYNTTDFKLYVRLYENNCLQEIDGNKFKMDGKDLISIEFKKEENIIALN